jgi:uncharacterized protein (DUF302 family)
MMYSIETDTPTEKIGQKLEEVCKTEGFGVMHTLVLPTILQSKGIDYTGDITVYEICNPAYAHSIIRDQPAASVYLPCRLSAARVGDKTVLTTNDLEAIMQNDTTASEAVKSSLTEVFAKIKSIMAAL